MAIYRINKIDGGKQRIDGGHDNRTTKKKDWPLSKETMMKE